MRSGLDDQSSSSRSNWLRLLKLVRNNAKILPFFYKKVKGKSLSSIQRPEHEAEGPHAFIIKAWNFFSFIFHPFRPVV